MKKIIVLYLLTFDNRIKYYVDDKNTTYKLLEAKRFKTNNDAKVTADKSKTMWKVGFERIPENW